jgi:predicted dithiol-disulfide oxidoreductase (DUF899 family)
MGWSFNWVSPHGNDFNRDDHVSLPPEDLANGKVCFNYGVTEFPVEEAPGEGYVGQLRIPASDLRTRQEHDRLPIRRKLYRPGHLIF